MSWCRQDILSSLGSLVHEVSDVQISTSEVEQGTEVPAIATYLKLDVNRSAHVNDGEANFVVIDHRDPQLLCAERDESGLSNDPSCR